MIERSPHHYNIKTLLSIGLLNLFDEDGLLYEEADKHVTSSNVAALTNAQSSFDCLTRNSRCMHVAIHGSSPMHLIG